MLLCDSIRGSVTHHAHRVAYIPPARLRAREGVPGAQKSPTFLLRRVGCRAVKLDDDQGEISNRPVTDAVANSTPGRLSLSVGSV